MNNVIITLKSKKTGNTTTLEPLIGVPITETMDDGLNTAVLTFKDDIKTLYEPFDPVEYVLTDSATHTVNMIVGGNETTIYNPKNKTYQRTMNLVEPTKILDRFHIYNLNLTNKSDTLKQQIEKAINNTVPLVDSDICNFALSDSLITMLGTTAGEDFFFKNTTLRAVLDDMLSVVDCRCYVDKLEINSTSRNYEQIIISYKNKNAISGILESSISGNLINDEHSNDLGDYAGKIQARGYNSVSNKAVTVGPEYFKSTSTALDTNNAIADLHFPIEEIKSFYYTPKTQILFAVFYGNSSSKFSTISAHASYSLNIIKYLIDSDYYALLSTNDKRNRLPYTRGESTVGFSATTKQWLISSYNITEIIGSVINDINATDEFTNYFVSNHIPAENAVEYWTYPWVKVAAQDVKGEYVDIANDKFQCSFIPRIDTTIEISKPGIYDIDRLKLGIMDGQSANSIDINRHGKNLAGLIRRTGNNELQLDYRCNSVSDLIPIMSKIADGEFAGYVVYKREYSIFNDFLKVRYSLTYDFNQINEKIGIVREKRIFNIPLESDDTPIYLKRYFVLSLSAPTDENDAFLQPDYMQAVLNTLRGVSPTDCKIKNVLFNTPESFVDQDGSGAVFSAAAQRFAIPALGYAASNSINIIANPLDNYSVGYSRGGYHISLWGGGVKMLYNPYTNINGENVSFQMRLAGGLTDTSQNVIEALPKTFYYDFAQASNDEVIYYKKDRSQRPIFVQSFEMIPSEADYGNLIIGDKFCAENFLINDNTDFSDNMYLYVRVSGADKYRTGDNKIKSGYIVIGNVKNFFFTAVYHSSGGAKYAQISSAYTAPRATVDFAIGDIDHNLFLAVNQRLTSTTKIYLQTKKLSDF